VTSRHESSSVARDDAVKAERARRRLIAYYIADLDLDGRRRPDLEQIPVAQERQHAAAARAQAKRVAGPEEGPGEIRDEDDRIGTETQGGVSRKRRRAIGPSSSSRNTSAHHSPYRPESVIALPVTGTRVVIDTGRPVPVNVLAKRW